MKRVNEAGRRPFALPLACAAAVAMVVVSEGSYWESVSSLDELIEISGTRSSVQALQQAILVAETGQRGYLLTERPEYLVPYAQALQDIAAAFERLDRYESGDAGFDIVLTSLHGLTATKLAQLSAAIRLHDEGQRAASTDVVLSALNEKQMESIRALANELLQRQTARSERGRQDLYHTLLLSRIGMTLLSAISLLAVFLYLRQSKALQRQQQHLQDVVKAERDRLEAEVAQRTAQLTELAQHLQTAREDERHRLARNLHDELGALLTSAKLDAARIKSRLAGTAPEALERLAHLVATLNESIALGRSIIEDLRPSTLSNLGLVATLEILASEFAERSNIGVTCELAPVRLNAGAELMVYRLVQEAITNVSKYAQARHVWIGLSTRDGQVQVSVRDDGVGFDTRMAPKSAHGLLGMRFRVEAEGGRLSVVSAPGQGTRVQATLPESADA